MGSTQSTWGIYSTLVIMKYTTLALLVAATSAVKIVGDGTPQNQLDYWTREKNDAAAAAKAAADAAQAKKDAAAQAAAAKAAAAHAKALNIESGNVWEHIPNYPGSQPLTNPDDVRESNFKASASDISDNTHIGEHWDGPKRGRIIREYRRAMDQCNISGTSKCTHDALGANYPNQPSAAFLNDSKTIK